jgi:4-hydroxythreonine-4-phosphate dehydrogenase
MNPNDAHPPIIGITMGDAAGVGPEVIVKALARADRPDMRAVVIGDVARLRMAAAACGIDIRVTEIGSLSDATWSRGEIEVLPAVALSPDLPWGLLSAEAGEGAYQCVVRAVELAQSGQIQAICTAPLNKEALHLAGHRFPGHTELLAELTGTDEVSMMLMSEKLKVIHVTTHIGLLDAVERIDAPLVQRTIERGHRTLVDAGISAPRIAVCGINPHAGENGLFGRGEEGEKIVPAIDASRALGIDVIGPLPADTVFFRAGRGDFDLVVAMYHDQGHAPIKVLGLEAGVNVTIGLPVVRTSVDHGTAFDIAGQGIANARSMVEAIEYAERLAAG